MANTNDFSAITGDKEVSDNLAIVVNNAGALMEGRFLEMAPEKLQLELNLNLKPMTLLTKYARNAFAKQYELSANPEKERFGFINMSGLISLYPIPNVSQCSGTKLFGDQLIRSVSKAY